MKIEGELGGENAHVQQCNNIPDIFIDGLRYLCECYQKFTYEKTLRKQKSQECLPRSSKRIRLVPENTTTVTLKQFLPNYCYFN